MPSAHRISRLLSTLFTACRSSFFVFFGLCVLCGGGRAWGQPLPSPEAVPPVSVAPRAPQEQILTPIPNSFNWMQREVRPNPLLETLLTTQPLPLRLRMTFSLTEDYSDNFF